VGEAGRSGLHFILFDPRRASSSEVARIVTIAEGELYVCDLPMLPIAKGHGFGVQSFIDIVIIDCDA